METEPVTMFMNASRNYSRIADSYVLKCDIISLSFPWTEYSKKTKSIEIGRFDRPWIFHHEYQRRETIGIIMRVSKDRTNERHYGVCGLQELEKITSLTAK